MIANKKWPRTTITAIVHQKSTLENIFLFSEDLVYELLQKNCSTFVVLVKNNKYELGTQKIYNDFTVN